MGKLVIALGWTPDTIHAPILIAHSLGLYRRRGVEVVVVNPAEDGYLKTPAKRLLNNEVDIAVCPSESVVAYAQGGSKSGRTYDDELEAVFALLDSDGSAIYCRPTAVTRARDLDGQTYGSYGARYEDDIVRAFVRRDGGTGDIVVSSLTPKLSLFQRVTQPPDLEGSIDATWIFKSWEGVKARLEGRHEGRELVLGDAGIKYGYSPVLCTRKRRPPASHLMSAFVAATREGYAYIRSHQADAVAILQRGWCPEESAEFLTQSFESVKTFYRADGNDGVMERSRWVDFLEFLEEEKLLSRSTDVDSLFTNRYF